MEGSTRHFGPWAKTCCDQCENEFQVTRCNAVVAKGQVLCGDCVDYNSAYQEGWDAAMGERHDQQVDSGDNYDDVLESPVGMISYQDDSENSIINKGVAYVSEEEFNSLPWNQPYTPEVGEECEISNCGNPYIWCKIEYMGNDLCVVSHEIHKEQHYHLNSAVFRPLKTERDIAIDQFIEINRKLGIGATERQMFEALYDAGLRIVK